MSAEYLQADLPVVGPQDVFREGADLTWTRGGLTLWGEVIVQQGQSVTEFPIAGHRRHRHHARGAGAGVEDRALRARRGAIQPWVR